jgi:DUF4097 and DUF4098 domain-containing protein YvlB
MRIKMVAPALAAVLLAAGSAGAQERVDQRKATGATGVVEIHNVAGSVRVVGWSRNEVHVTGTLGRGSDRLTVADEGGRLVVRVAAPRSGRNNRGSEIEVRIPARKTVNVHTVSADIDVREVAGTVEARAVSGGVGVRGRPREVIVQSRSGNVVFDGQTEHVNAQSVSGDVQVGGTVRDEVEASSVSGNVAVTAGANGVRATSVSGNVEVGSNSGRAEVSSVSGDLRVTGRRLHGAFQTVSGNIFVSGDLARDGTTTFNTHSGVVELRIASGSSAAVDVSTFSGNIRNDVSGARITRSTNREQRFTVGRGEARVSLRTFSGDVRMIDR